MKIPHVSVMIAQVLFLISVFVVDLSQSVESTAAFSSANKVTSGDGSSSISSSNRQKRTVSDDNFFGDLSDEQKALEVLKRAPGWGKRSFESYPESESLGSNINWIDGHDSDEGQDMVAKRAPGWGKRAETVGYGWESHLPSRGVKRAPGWGKRAPGWGKRAPGWGKRAPGWGKRSADVCTKMDKLVGELMMKLEVIKTVRSQRCGSDVTENQSFRK